MERERKVYTLDGAAAGDRETLHRYLRGQLPLPEYYGDNLDALYDALTDIAEDTVIELENAECFELCLGWYGRQLMRVLQDAAEDNEYLTINKEKEREG